MTDVRSFRFIIPPMVFLAVLWWGVFTDPRVCIQTIIEPVIDAYPELKEYMPGVVGLLVTAIGFFGVGFIISTASTVLLRICHHLDCRSQGPGVYWNKEAVNQLHKLFNIDNLKLEGEFLEQAIQAKAPKHLADWVSRRWEYFITNFQSLLVVLAASWLFVPLRVDPSWLGWIVIFLFAVCLGWNGRATFRSAMEMDHFILRNLSFWERFR